MDEAADRRILVRVGAERLLVDPVSGVVAPLAVSPGFEPEVVAGTRVVGRGPKGEVLVRDGDAAPRPVFPD